VPAALTCAQPKLAPATGIWVFFAGDPGEPEAAAAAFGREPGIAVVRPAAGFFVVRSRTPRTPVALIRLGRRLRLAWQAAVPANARVAELLDADEELLASPRCTPYGVLGDPDITPHWPPPRGPHQ
jgi:hypothetical protein